MKLTSSDYVLSQVAGRFPDLMKEVGDLETRFLDSRLSQIDIKSPLFISGLARGGTTILLNVLSQHKDVATHRYRDFPFVFFPCAWYWFLELFPHNQKPVERPHNDGIFVSRESPEAFEEPLWQYFFPELHDPAATHVLSSGDHSQEFKIFFKDHIRKILLLRSGKRYLSKGNYNIARIQYLATLFPDARFFICIRHPLAHVHSLFRQHCLFCHYAREDKRIPKYLRVAGHYEFGLQRTPINFSSEATQRIQNAWLQGQDHIGYAIQWSQVYGFVSDLLDNPEVSKQIDVVRHEDLCTDPAGVLKRLDDFAALGFSHEELAAGVAMIHTPKPTASSLSPEVREKIWAETARVAEKFGYCVDDDF